MITLSGSALTQWSTEPPPSLERAYRDTDELIRSQAGDRVLIYTDGVTESHSPDGVVFGVDRLADLLVRASTEERSPAETVRRLAAAVVAPNAQPLRDDATLFMLDYHGRPAEPT